MGLKVSPVPMASREAAGAIDAAIKQLDAVRRAAERRRQLLDALSGDLGSSAAKPKPDLALLRDKVAIGKQQIQETRGKLSAEQARSAEVRRQQADLKEQSEQLEPWRPWLSSILGRSAQSATKNTTSIARDADWN
jgi:chromosome segregation ATPase